MKHYEDTVLIKAPIEKVFAYADNFANFSSHMNKPSLMMGGGKMITQTDEGKGQKIGSHIKMLGNVIDINLFLDEVTTIHEPPYNKEWQTVGKINLLVIDHYKLGFNIKSVGDKFNFKVYIDYDLSKSPRTRLLGRLFGDMYAKWCVHQMTKGVATYFNK